jgi:8-oxo-dGTP diphosphatase
MPVSQKDHSSLKVPVDVVCAVILHEGKILVAQRPPGKKLAGLWEFPGGKVEPNETPAEALHREIQEELGCTLKILQEGPPVLHAYEWGAIQLFPFFCQLTAPNHLPTALEHSQITWVFQKNLTDLELAPADIPVVKWLESRF